MNKRVLKDKQVLDLGIKVQAYIIMALLLVCLVQGLYIFSFQSDSEVAQKMLEITEESHRKQLDVIKKAHEKEKAAREERIVSYIDAYNELNQRYEDDKKELAKLKKEKVTRKLIQFQRDKKAFAISIEEEYGFKYVE